jgi:predicted metal-dependent hydrolase
MMGFIKKQNQEGIKTIRKWWKFWENEEVTIFIPTRYDDAWKEVEIKKGNQTTWSLELEDWVKEDIRGQLEIKCQNYLNKIKRSKKLKVNFYTWRSISAVISMDFYYIDGEIYFDSDKSLKRQKILDKIGI